ncbi:MAG: 1-acyl-sn-glycerol-3-phosphate acyltransferase [Candidatus Omnitrophica bacterium]|nr:1-acyl-sn-glycerol-3-phosphate acyltransferase [Candidatus Omnitrophota bacterium]
MTQSRNFIFDLTRSSFRWTLVGLITIIVFFPTLIISLILWPFDRDRKQVHPLVSFWAKAILIACPLMKVHVEGAERLKPNGTYVLIANHQSIADIIAVLHLPHPFKFVAKQELFWIPFLGWSLWCAAYIPLIRGNRMSGKRAVDQASGYLQRGVSVLLFPEGTRSPNGEIQAFKVGAFKLAREVNVPIVPIVIQGTRDLLPKGSRLLARRVKVTLQVGFPEPPSERSHLSLESFSEQVREEMIRSLKSIRSKSSTGDLVST